MLTRARAVAVAAVWTCFLIGAAGTPPGVAGATPPAGQLSADLDGKPIALADVGNWFCHDFASPKIHCFSSSTSLEASVAPILATTTDNYVIVYDQPTFAGSYMYMSQDYTVLALIGWNDRISSFIGLNGESGHFFTDWFYGGSSWYFCCNDQTSYLGGYDNTFSSVHRG